MIKKEVGMHEKNNYKRGCYYNGSAYSSCPWRAWDKTYTRKKEYIAFFQNQNDVFMRTSAMRCVTSKIKIREIIFSNLKVNTAVLA
jgi:heterodisulfide reductase subunit C